MLYGQKIIAFTPCGRKRYMDLLAAHVVQQHERGHIDKWILFNNAYKPEDSTYAAQLAAQLPWVQVLETGQTGKPERIADFYRQMTEHIDVIYLRLDDDIIYIEDHAIPRMVKYRLENPNPFIVFPVIINNVRTSYHLQQAGQIPRDWGIVENEMCDHMAHRNSDFVQHIHKKALSALERGKLVEEFKLPSEQFTDWDSGYISINCFVIFGRDMVECGATVHANEERYLSVWRPKELNRHNARCGDAMVIHFAYHTQTEFMDKTGMLADYVKLVPLLGFQVIPLA